MSDQNIAAIPPDPEPGSFVYDLTNNDILCGRGSGPNDHIGNINFRDLISHKRKNYLTTSSRAEKARIAIEILNDVRMKQPPGRFLERVPGKGKSNPMWVVVEEEKAMEKIKQALRQIRNRQGSTSPTRPRPNFNANVMNQIDNLPAMQLNAIHALNSMNVNMNQTHPVMQMNLTNQNGSKFVNPQMPMSAALPSNLNTNQAFAPRYVSSGDSGNSNIPPQTYPYPTPNAQQLQTQQLPSQQLQSQQLQPQQLQPQQLQPQQLQPQQLQPHQLQSQQLQSQQLQSQQKPSHLHQAQQQFQKSIGRDEAPLKQVEMPNVIEPQPYNTSFSGSDVSAIGNMSLNKLIKVLGRAPSTDESTVNRAGSSITNYSLSDVLPGELDSNSNVKTSLANLNEGDSESVAFPSPKTNQKYYRRSSSSQSRMSGAQSMMSVDFLASSMGDMSIADIITEPSNDNDAMTKTQKQMYFKKMSDMSIDQVEKIVPRTISDMLKDTDQDSLRDIGTVLKRLESDDDH